MIAPDMFRDIMFYARAYHEKNTDHAHLKKILEETEEWVVEVKDVIDWMEKDPSKIKKVRTIYEGLIEETYDILILCLVLGFVFEDEAMWVLKFHEKTRQWREYLGFDD